jgi:solute carrier family 25 (adenine nucleotide translocator) protein 4/5/6/31
MQTAQGPSGPRGLYNGFGVSVIGIIPYRGVYFGMYDSLSGLNPLRDHPGALALGVKFAIAQTTAITAGYVSYPFDTVRRRLQMQSEKPKAEWLYNGTLDCLRKIVKEEGATALFKGAGANVIRTLGSALVLVLYDEVKHWKYVFE